MFSYLSTKQSYLLLCTLSWVYCNFRINWFVVVCTRLFVYLSLAFIPAQATVFKSLAGFSVFLTRSGDTLPMGQNCRKGVNRQILPPSVQKWWCGPEQLNFFTLNIRNHTTLFELYWCARDRTLRRLRLRCGLMLQSLQQRVRSATPLGRPVYERVSSCALSSTQPLENTGVRLWTRPRSTRASRVENRNTFKTYVSGEDYRNVWMFQIYLWYA